MLKYEKVVHVELLRLYFGEISGKLGDVPEELLTLALPRIRDFRGINGHQFDGQGNYNFGLTEQSMFHEIDPDSIDHQRGMDITVVTSTKDDDEAYALLKALGFPFKEN